MASKVATKPLDVIEDPETGNRFVVYTTKTGVHMDVHFDGEEPWFTQKDLATMFGVDSDTVGDHIQKFRADGELEEATTGKFPVVGWEGERRVTRQILHYSLDVAFYVGYSEARPNRRHAAWPARSSAQHQKQERRAGEA